MQWTLGARSETGYVRAANEDRMGFTRTPFGNVYVVSDGMGGYRGGALAAELTVSTLQECLAALPADSAAFPERVREAFAAANQAVLQRRRADDPDTRNMGATGVVLVTAGSRALVGHVGDSRAYLARYRERTLRQITRDHTRVQRMIDAGMLTPEQADQHPEASVLDRAIGHDPTVQADVGGWIDLKPRDMILLCSDGLSGYVGDAEIAQVMRSKGSPQELADKLVDLALGKGGEDNVTVQLVRFDGQAGTQWWKCLGEPAIVAPAAMFASAAVVWGVTSPRLDAADAQIAVLRKQLAESQRSRSELLANVQNLSSQLESKTRALVAAAVPAPTAPASDRALAPSAVAAAPKKTVIAKATSPRASARPASSSARAPSAPAVSLAASAAQAAAPASAGASVPAAAAPSVPAPSAPSAPASAPAAVTHTPDEGP